MSPCNPVLTIGHGRSIASIHILYISLFMHLCVPFGDEGYSRRASTFGHFPLRRYFYLPQDQHPLPPGPRIGPPAVDVGRHSVRRAPLGRLLVQQVRRVARIEFLGLDHDQPAVEGDAVLVRRDRAELMLGHGFKEATVHKELHMVHRPVFLQCGHEIAEDTRVVHDPQTRVVHGHVSGKLRKVHARVLLCHPFLVGVAQLGMITIQLSQDIVRGILRTQECVRHVL